MHRPRIRAKSIDGGKRLSTNGVGIFLHAPNKILFASLNLQNNNHE
ncbi:MAG: hypothetical protein ACI9RU_000078 [Litorivivens sp.]|jgi:hypothetical protein